MEVLAVFASIFLFFFVIVIGVSIAAIVGEWKILTKAGEPGWGALIPIYSQYMLCKITGVNPYWLLIVFLSPILTIIPIIGSLATLAVSVYFTVLLGVSLARSFGKDDGFAVGLILLQPIFYLILGFGKDEYVGKKPMDDILFGKKDSNNSTTPDNGTTNNEISDDVKYCTSCGAQLSKTTNFCPYCGNESK